MCCARTFSLGTVLSSFGGDVAFEILPFVVPAREAACGALALEASGFEAALRVDLSDFTDGARALAGLDALLLLVSRFKLP